MSETVKKMVTEDVKNNKVILYMKGTPESPMCGFSARVVEILKEHKAPFKARNVLDDPDLRQGIKDFTEWPTIPQVFINGEFIGGCDIVAELHENGELAKLLSKK